MDAIDERATKIREKISNVLKNADNLSQAKIDAVWEEATAYIRDLPKKERGNFYWNSGLECLFLLTSESKEDCA